MKRALALALILLLGAVLLDEAVTPVILGPRAQTRFAAAAAVLAGMKWGRWRGLAFGWLGGILVAALTCEPAGISAFSLGGAGFLAGYCRGAAFLGFPALDALIVFGLLVVEDLLGGIAATLVGVPFTVRVLPILATAVVVLFALRRLRNIRSFGKPVE